MCPLKQTLVVLFYFILAIVVPLMFRHVSTLLQYYIWETDYNTGYVLNAVRLIDLFIFVNGHIEWRPRKNGSCRNPKL